MNQIIKTAAAVVMACVFTLGVKANDGTKEINASFKHDFQNAQLISTEVKDNFTKVTFTLNDQVMTAFYSADGSLLGVTRNIVSSQLPVNLLVSFKKHYSAYWVTDLFEMSQDSQSNYYLTLENADTKITLRSNGEDWDVYSNIKK